jgi:hypothetical protein
MDGRSTIDTPVEIRDNGIRCFMPPCFNFDLVDASGNVVATVSQVVLDVEGQEHKIIDFDAIGLLSRYGLFAMGDIVEYDAGPEAREPGFRLSATRLVPKPSVPGPG